MTAQPEQSGTDQATSAGSTDQPTESTRGKSRRGRRGGRGRGGATGRSGRGTDRAETTDGQASTSTLAPSSSEAVSSEEVVAEGAASKEAASKPGTSRDRAPRPSVTEGTATDGGTAPDGGTAADDGMDADDGARRRRRRGRRGRGRGKTSTDGPADAEAPTPDADPQAGKNAGGRTTGGGTTSGGTTRRSASGAEGKAKDGAKPGGGGDDGKGRGADADDVEAEIARGGTRMAAKKSNRRSGGGNGGNRRGAQRPGGVPEEVRRAILEGPPRTMLVTAREDRTQIAVMEDRSVVEHYVTRKDEVTFVGNIYMARVQNVLPGMEAAFLDIGKGRNGVLYAGEVLFDELDLEEGADPRIENVLKPGQKVLVQVTKDPMGTKGPRLTMHLSLAGRYVVLAPDSDLFGISRKLTDRERDRLRRLVKQVKPSQHGVIVRTAAEGATEEQITADMQRLLAKWDKVAAAAEGAKALTAVYEEPSLVVKVIRDNFGPEFERCIVDEEELYHQVRGYLEEVADELLPKVELYGAPTRDARARAAGAPAAVDPTDDPAAAPGEVAGEVEDGGQDGGQDGDEDGRVDVDPGEADAEAGVGTASEGDVPAEAEGDAPVAASADGDESRAAAPTGSSNALGPQDLAAAASRRESLPPLFEAYDVADQLRKAMGRKIWLPSGGYLIIETTEAMKVIDVNTGKFTGGKDTNLEEVVLKTNLEAADEIVRQLRLRDMGGIIIIDFIDMLLKANQDQVVRRLKRELLRDRTKTRVSEVSRLGLVQMTRKNVSQGLVESFSHTCQHCEGRGIIGELE